MKNKLLITTALVAAFCAVQEANAIEWKNVQGDMLQASGVNALDNETTMANSITTGEGVELNMSGSTVEIADTTKEDWKWGSDYAPDEILASMGLKVNEEGFVVDADGNKINLSENEDYAVLAGYADAAKSGVVSTNGSKINLNGGNSIEANAMNFKNTELNFSGATNTLKSPLVNFENTVVNVNKKGAFALNGARQDLNAAGKNVFNTKDGGVELKNATLNIADGASFAIVDTSGEEAQKGNLVVDASLDKDDFATTVNNSGVISANVSGNGVVNFVTENAVIDGDVTGGKTNIYFKDKHSLGAAITGEINVAQMMIDNDGILDADEAFVANDLVVGSKDARSGTGMFNLLADASVGGAKINKGSTLNLGDNKLTVTGGHVLGNDYVRLMDGSTLAFNFGKGQVVENVNLEGKVNLNPVIAIGTEGGTHEFVTGTISRDDKTINGSDFGGVFTKEEAAWVGYDNNSLYDIELSDDEKSMTISKKSHDDVASVSGATSNQVSAIMAVTSGLTDNETFNAAANSINELMQSADKNNVKAGADAATVLAPEVAPMVQHKETETTNQVFGAISTRLTGGTISTGGEGMASGDNIFERAAMWVQGLFNKSKLDDTSDAYGFDSDSSGIAMGAEKYINDNTKVGLGYAYTNTDIDGFMRTTDVDTHTAFVYGEYKPSNWYVNGIASYGWSDYSENKNVAGVGINADYDVETLGLQAMTGYEMQMNNFVLTPEAGLRYVHINQDGYTDSAGQKISDSDSDILTGIVGAKVSKDFALENGMNIKPEVRVAATYDLMNDDVNSVVTLANGSSYVVEGDALDRFGMEFGAGITAEVNDNVEFALGYEGKFREDYQDHTGLLNAKYKF